MESISSPLVSIVIPCYNGSEFIGDAIGTVSSQSYGNWEIIVIDDGSEDDSVDVVGGFEDDRIRLLSHSENRGIAATRNTGIEAANGEFVAFLDQDDLWDERKLEKSVRAASELDNPGLVQTGLKKTYPNESPEVLAKRGYSRISEEELALDLLFDRRPFYTASTIMVSRAAFDELGSMNDRLTRWDDKEMWIRILLDDTFDAACIEEPLVTKRQHDERTTSTSGTDDLFRLHRILMRENRELRKYRRKHLSYIYYRHGGQQWRSGISRGHLSVIWISFLKSIYYDPKHWRPYLALPLSVFGKTGHRFSTRAKKLLFGFDANNTLGDAHE